MDNLLLLIFMGATALFSFAFGYAAALSLLLRIATTKHFIRKKLLAKGSK